MSAILEPVPAPISVGPSESDHDLGGDIFTHLAPGYHEWLRARWDSSRRLLAWKWGDNVAMCQSRGCRREPRDAVGLCQTCKAAFDSHDESDLHMWLATYSPAPDSRETGPQKCAVRNDIARCGRPALQKTLCKSHSDRWKWAGRPDLKEWMRQQTPFPEPGLCAVGPCLRDRTAQGPIAGKLCRFHGENWSKARLPDDCLPSWTKQQAPAGLTASDLWLGGLETPILEEFLFSIAADTADGARLMLDSPRNIAEIARHGRDMSLGSLTTTGLSYRAGQMLRRWRDRLDILRADPDTEWLKDSVRLAVVKRCPELGATALPLGRISQPWLRQMMIDYCRASLVSFTPRTLRCYMVAMGRLSAFLATRHDHGDKPQALTAKAMDAYAESVSNTTSMPTTVTTRLEAVGSCLTQCQALGLTRRYGLEPDFRVYKRHYPKLVETSSFEERAFPDATFRFLLGADDNLGPRVLDLLRAIPGQEFDGALAVEALQLSANFGRRPNELCSLNADRIRLDDGTGQAAILYDNFKSGRSKVWLPIDARSAKVVSDWMALLRRRYPSTALTDLALLPAPKNNPHGTKHISANTVAGWFRTWVILLEQAIVIAQLHKTTGIPIPEICQLTTGAFTGLTLVTTAGEIDLPSPIAATLADYHRDLHERSGADHEEHVGDNPLFPCPIAPRVDRPDGMPSVGPARFDALGSGWETLAARYASGGIPGGHLGRQRTNPGTLTPRRFRHTYLQHLVDIGTDIFVVQELADHSSVQTTIDSYVQVRNEALREAVDVLNQHRIDRFGTAGQRLAFVPTITTRDVATNRCDNPQVLKLGTEGCEYDRQCYDCDHYSTDPSYLNDIKAEIQTCRLSLQRLETEDPQRKKPHHIAVLKERLAGWKQTLSQLQAHLDALPPTGREEVLVAAEMVWNFRNRARAGGALSFGSTDLGTQAT